MTHEAILETHDSFGEHTLIADPARIVDFCRYLKEKEQFNRLSAVTAVDWYPAEPRFEVVYHLHSIELNQRLRIKCRVGSAKPEIDSVTAVWRSAAGPPSWRSHPTTRPSMSPKPRPLGFGRSTS